MILPQEIRHKARDYSTNPKLRQAFSDGAIAYAEWAAGNNDNGLATDDVVEITDVQFEEFWKLYDKKVGKPKSEKLWSKLSKTDKQKCLEYIRCRLYSRN